MIRRFCTMMAWIALFSVELHAQQTMPAVAAMAPVADVLQPADVPQGMGCGERFVAMPDSLSPLLTAVNRADLVDFMANGMRAEVDNRLAGRTRMTQLSSTYLRLQHSSQADWQMKLLPTAKGDTLICVVETVRTPVVDSHLLLFDSRWNRLPLQQILPQLPRLDDFLSPEAHATFRAEHASAALLLSEAAFEAEGELLTIRFTTPDSIDEEAKKRLTPYLHPLLTYRWQGSYLERITAN